jgi:uncharacterized protein YlzI (FlbEa/FlbD family)
MFAIFNQTNPMGEDLGKVYIAPEQVAAVEPSSDSPDRTLIWINGVSFLVTARPDEVAAELTNQATRNAQARSC